MNELEFVAQLDAILAYFGSYHHHKELMSWAALVLLTGLVGGACGLASNLRPTCWRLSLTGLFVAYCYFLSYGLPPGADAAKVGEAIPAITLTSWDGSRVDLQRASEQPLVLVFYRGFW